RPRRGRARLSFRRGRCPRGRGDGGRPRRRERGATDRGRNDHRGHGPEGEDGPGGGPGRDPRGRGGGQGAPHRRLHGHPDPDGRGGREAGGQEPHPPRAAVSALLPVYDRDLVIVSGKGARVTDADGRTYLDFAAGIGVNGLGYGDREVVAAIRKQARKLIHASNLYYSEPVRRLADRLTALAFPSKVFFCNSGTEAVEAAMKFARRIGGSAGRTEFVAFERAFHGRTMGALSMT